MACDHVSFIHLSSFLITASGLYGDTNIFISHLRIHLLQVAFTECRWRGRVEMGHPNQMGSDALANFSA